MQDIHHILKTYWGYDQFRPLQEAIVLSVQDGKDTLALLPTGGGKSICFQVPAIAKDGICLVITPLIALMKDQVEQLKKRDIPAVAVYSGMNRREIDIALDNCVYGNIKFLYLSPERLLTDIFQERVKRMKVNLLAVDEAHCISQWGYDFRPPYLQLAELRELLPGVPVIALTATATEHVRKDIQEKLRFKQPNVFVKSFARSNLSYSCLYTEDKIGRLLEILQRMPGQSIVYVRSRRQTVEIARFLQSRQIPAGAYHAGLKFEERSKTQQAWIEDKVRVMVATNAFGMGIDKPDVRLVVHLDLPESLEAYYQEAGRAGRDEKYSYAVILYGPSDVADLHKKVEEAHPPLELIRRVYQCLANYYQLAVGSGAMSSFDFEFADFAKNYKLKALEVHHAIKRLEGEGYLQLSEGYYSPSRVFIQLNNTALYEFQVMNPEHDNLLRLILRMYGGEAFANFVKISERKLAEYLKRPEEEIRRKLEYLHKLQVIVYEPQHDSPQLVFTKPRQDAHNLPLNHKKLDELRERALKQVKEMGKYVENTNRCRTQLLLAYFNEISDESCRICDFCLAQRKKTREEKELGSMREKVLTLLQQKPYLPKELVQQFEPKDAETITTLVRELVDVGEVAYTTSGQVQKA
ncbi:RecQ family ATP-dependent DNA helicase [Pontibacter sp. BT310]|uniref:ATP-dependent DNA helicase RecQ n=1 Tax=Pontibacter populi TaxID=890055 RepID=A0ABS6XDT1_9BACT|nr:MULTISPECIES: ATP-dependent DNA helicase RecQ [Pontibacter]MBJ6118975.1 RecQ family ATP-dependent DNA helicase [Pontibacter sp. BT310]MBR0571403.1 RecQ family ATP-dependent DNA helicase [Microvirga sp. STS03]MBW3365829.1 RecQ family ATP-dependent DNA helicase [Pontibacter populi]